MINLNSVDQEKMNLVQVIAFEPDNKVSKIITFEVLGVITDGYDASSLIKE
jgi:hypothetical protein